MPKGVYVRKHEPKIIPAEIRFWKFVEKCQDGCWRWTGVKNSDGYGNIKINGKHVKAHRFSYGIHHPITLPMTENHLCILHSCNNPACVNPEHLRLGTHQENMNDKMIQGRGRGGNQKGEEIGNSKLTEKQVLEIRNRYDAGGITQQKLADDYGVTRSLIGFVINRKIWKHI